MSDDKKVKIIKPPDTLSKKVTKGGPGAVDFAAIERAEAVIADMSESYLDWVLEDLNKLDLAQNELKAHLDQPSKYINKVFQISHDMKGQGGSFGYDLMTILGNDLCSFLEDKETASDIDIEIIDLYIATMHNVISNRMVGDGGFEGKKVLDGLAAVVEKVGIQSES